jgi:hypothetical protein
MGALSSVQALPVLPNLTVDLSEFGGEGAQITFRAPKLPDLIVPSEHFREVQLVYPSFPEKIIRQVVIMGRCYIKAADDPADFSATAELVRIADEHPPCYMAIAEAFSDAYPSDFGLSVASAKNGSAA